MATGTGGGYWDDQNLPSRFKHELLRCYIPPFGGMTGSRDKQVVYFDGYAGEGRYTSGEPGSAEIAMRVAADHLDKGLRWQCFFTEKDAASVERLRLVAAEYQQRGVDARVHHSDAQGLLDQVLQAGIGQPLFLFLDPCGLTLPFEDLVNTLAVKRPPGPRNWPPTELLMNFSMMAVRRLGGNARSTRGLEASSARFDAVCGGPWWREYFTSGDLAPEDAAQHVATGYARRLGRATGMHVVSVPVAKAPAHKPIYNLVFATRSQHGLWVFGDAAARAKEKWWEKVELTEESNDDALFTVASMERPDPEKVQRAAVPAIAENIEQLLNELGRAFKLVDHTARVFGEYYGQVTEPIARKAVKLLHEHRKTATTGRGGKPRDLVVTPPPR